MDSFVEDDFAGCVAIIRSICLLEDKADRWIEKVKEGNWDAIVGLVLALLPNLETIEVGNLCWMEEKRERFIDHVFGRAARLQQEGKLDEMAALPKLRSISIDPPGFEIGIRIPTVLPYLKPKSIKKVCISNIRSDIFYPIPDFGGQILYTEELKLQCSSTGIRFSHPDGKCLNQFISCFRSLKEIQLRI